MDYSLLSRFRPQLMGAAILWVMAFHATDMELGVPLLNWIRAAGFGGVDIFILLSAMGLAMSLCRREQDYASYMARRCRRLLPAYYLVMVPYTVYLVLARGAAWSTLFWNASLLYYWARIPDSFNWYVAGTMLLYAIAPMCVRRLRRSAHRTALTAAAAAAGLCLCQLMMQEEFWVALDLWYRLPLFFLGLLLGFYVLEGRRAGPVDALVWTASLAAGGVYLWAVSLEQQVVQLPLCHLFLFTTVPMCLALCWCFQRLPLGWLEKLLGLLGRCSLEIYLLNVSFFSLVMEAIGPGSPWAYLPAFGANLALGIGLHRLLEGLQARRTQLDTAG